MARIKQTLPELSEAMLRFSTMLGVAWSDVIRHEGKEWSYELAKAFSDVSPLRGTILTDAKARGYRMGRDSNALTPATAGISDAAHKKALALLEGQKSDLFRISGWSGTITVKRVRYSGSTTGRRADRFLIGGRAGNRFAPSARRFKDLAADVQARKQEEIKRLGLKRLNERALAAAIEIQYRTRAGRGNNFKGGLMAVQWLPKLWRKIVNENSPLRTDGSRVYRAAVKDLTVQSNRTKVPLGSVEIHTNGKVLTGLSLHGLVPGVAEVAARHGIVERVSGARISDRNAYIEKKMAQLHAEAFEKGATK